MILLIGSSEVAWPLVGVVFTDNGNKPLDYTLQMANSRLYPFAKGGGLRL